jgi:hypothetical protein
MIRTSDKLAHQKINSSVILKNNHGPGTPSCLPGPLTITGYSILIKIHKYSKYPFVKMAPFSSRFSQNNTIKIPLNTDVINSHFGFSAQNGFNQASSYNFPEYRP